MAEASDFTVEESVVGASPSTDFTVEESVVGASPSTCAMKEIMQQSWLQ